LTLIIRSLPGHSSLLRNWGHELVVEPGSAVKHRCRDPHAVGESANQVKIMLQRRSRTLGRNKPPSCHPGCASAELGRPAAPIGNGLDHEIDIYSRLETERHRFRSRRDMDCDQQVVHQLDPARGTKRAEIEALVGETGNDPLRHAAGFLVARQVNHCLASRDHSRRTAHLAIEEHRAFLRKWRDVLLFIWHCIGSQLDDDLALMRRFQEPAFAVHHVGERLR
jgi:hypothetical protein